MRKNKKKGFTLIELIVTLAIIAMLTVVLTPKLAGYITEARKTQVLTQMRNIVIGAESYNVKETATAIKDTETFAEFKTKLVTAGYLDDKTNSMIETQQYSNIKALVNGEKQFNIVKNEQNTESIVIQ